MVKYNESTIYKLCCKDPNVTDEYVGSTTNFNRRKSKHKSCCHNKNSKDYNAPVYQFIRDNGNFENWDMVEVEKYEATDKQDLHKRERYLIETLKSSLNKHVPTQTEKEHYQVHKERLIADAKKYYEDNKEAIVAHRKIHREANKERLNTICREYHQENSEIINAKRRVAITCECGTIISKAGLSQHRRSKKHLELMELVK